MCLPEGLSAHVKNPAWRKLCNRLLGYAKAEGFMNRELAGNLKKKKIDQVRGALGELLTVYFLRLRCGFSVTPRPPGREHKKGDIEIIWKPKCIFCEVKVPHWETPLKRELREVEKSDPARAGELRGRLADPSKYLPAQGGWFANFEDVRAAVKRALEQIPRGKPSLVILPDDLWVGLYDDDRGMSDALYASRKPCMGKASPRCEGGVFLQRDYRRVGAVGALWSNPRDDGMPEFKFRLYHNPNACEESKVPSDVFSRFQQVDTPCWEREGNTKSQS